MNARDNMIDVQDSLQKGLDITRTAWVALNTTSLLTDEMLGSVANTLCGAIEAFERAEQELRNTISAVQS